MTVVSILLRKIIERKLNSAERKALRIWRRWKVASVFQFAGKLGYESACMLFIMDNGHCPFSGKDKPEFLRPGIGLRKLKKPKKSVQHKKAKTCISSSFTEGKHDQVAYDIEVLAAGKHQTREIEWIAGVFFHEHPAQATALLSAHLHSAELGPLRYCRTPEE